MFEEAQELCMRRDYFQIISGEGMEMGDTFFILLEIQTGMLDFANMVWETSPENV